MPARDLFGDEIDAYPVDVDGEGDPLELALARTRTFKRNRKVFLASTPTTKGASRIEDWHAQGDQRRYLVPCPHCSSFQPIDWARMTWEKDEDGGHLPETVGLTCEACNVKIEEHHKTEMLAAGHWQATVEAIDPRVRSYQISALYSPLGWYSWVDAVRDFLKAKRQGTESLKAWVNTVLGETWEEEAEEVDPHILMQRRRKYPAPVPAAAILLTAGVDIQGDRIELEIIGWAPDLESWGIRYRVLWGDVEQPEVWEELDAALAETYLHESGAKLGIYAAAIDAGFKTSQVYEFCRTRQGRRIFAVMGKDGPGRPMVSAPQQRRTGQKRRPVRLFTLGVDPIKAQVYSRFRLTDIGPGFCHFPLGQGYDEETFQQFTSERVITRYRRGVAYQAWVKKRARNEALDCRAYATGALIIADPAWKALVRRLEKQGKNPTTAKKTSRRRSSYATNWRK
jgi:phage terminase large subunit GpA-like protein